MPIEGSIKAMVDKEFADLPAEFRKKFNLVQIFIKRYRWRRVRRVRKARIAVAEAFAMDKNLEHAFYQSDPKSHITNSFAPRT